MIITIVHFRVDPTLENVETWVSGFGLWAPLVFMTLYIIGPDLFLPGSIFTLTGGALFGPLWGTVYSLIAATAGATVAFLIARYLASDWVLSKIGGRLKELVQGVNDEGWRFVAFVRLAPLFPFNLLNYALGLTKIRSYHYVVATFVCMGPGAFAYTYLGYAGREAVGGGEGLITKGTEFANATMETLRFKLLKVGARVIELKTKIKVHLPTAYPYKKVFRKSMAVFSHLQKMEKALATLSMARWSMGLPVLAEFTMAS